MRLWIAYGLIALVLAAVVGGIAFIRHNRPDRKYLRERDLEDQKIRDRRDVSDAPE